jgi:hypothetical protein
MLPERAIMLVLEFTCIALALTLVYLFFKVCNTKRSNILLGLPFGFFFLMLSYVFLGMHLIDLTFQNVDVLSSSIMWLRVVTQTVGILLITCSYLFASRYQHITRSSYLITLAGSTVLVLGAFGALYFFKPIGIESIYADTNLFSLVNIVLLSFIICLLVRRFQVSSKTGSGLISAPVAFIFLWLGQLCFLVFAYAGGGNTALILSQIARVISLVLFIRIYYVANKEVSTYAGEQTEQS